MLIWASVLIGPLPITGFCSTTPILTVEFPPWTNDFEPSRVVYLRARNAVFTLYSPVSADKMASKSTQLRRTRSLQQRHLKHVSLETSLHTIIPAPSLHLMKPLKKGKKNKENKYGLSLSSMSLSVCDQRASHGSDLRFYK